jgi:hypothetical protein
MAPTEPPVRWGLVNEVKAAIAAGTYDNPDRWDAALDALADRLL